MGFAESQREEDPSKQSDLFILGPATPATMIRDFVEVGKYDFSLTVADPTLVEWVRVQIQQDFPEQCLDVLLEDSSVHSYELGSDGKLIAASCTTTSTQSTSVYYHFRSDGSLRLVTFEFPRFNDFSPTSLEVAPAIIGYEPRTILPNSEILQRRLLSRSTLRAGELWSFRAEWVWKVGVGPYLYDCFSLRSGDDGKTISKSLVKRP